ncbi:MAG: hypothetical protein B7Y51_09615 [Burkholderiales bacterium 28-67-8]|nr:MAG: hypothetical protein B7Y51_09615 [Burkholderiales bacterium 28-67-8]
MQTATAPELDDTFAQLMAKASEKGDLPGFSQSARSILNALSSDAENDAELVQTVLTDAGLTQRVLRLANSAMYNVFGGEVTSVTRAVQVLGVQTVAHLALGLKVMESVGRGRPSSEGTLAEMQKSVLAGFMGRQLAGSQASLKDAEAAAVCAVLMGLGRMMVCFYLPQAWSRIQAETNESTPEDDVARAALGGTFADIGQRMTRQWGLPASLTNCLQSRIPENGQGPATHEERLSMLATAATQCARILHAEPEDPEAGVSGVVGVFANSLGLEADVMNAAIRAARTAARQHFDEEPAALVQPVTESERQARLLRGFRDLQEAGKSATPTQMLNLSLEYLHSNFGAKRSFCFLRSPKDKSYAARFGLGDGSAALLSALHFDHQQHSDVFSVVLNSGKVLFVEDAKADNLQSKLPPWWLGSLGSAVSFCIIPLDIDGSSVGFLYVDWAPPVSAPRMDIVRTRTMSQVRDILVSHFSKARA